MATSLVSTGVSYPDSTVQQTQYGNKQFIAEYTASNSAALYPAFSNTYNHYELVFNNLLPVTQSVSLWAYFNVAGAYRGLNYYRHALYGIYNTNNGAFYGGDYSNAPLCPNTYWVNYSNGGVSGRFTVYNTRQTTNIKAYEFVITGYLYTSGYLGYHTGGGFWDGTPSGVSGITNTIDGMQINASSGNISSGSIALYGFN